MKTKLSALALLATLLPSCVTYQTVKDEPRRAVRFSSPHATELFYRAYHDPGVETRSVSVRVGVPVPELSPYWKTTHTTDNVRFNSAVDRTDADRNGLITEKEAAAFFDTEMKASVDRHRRDNG